MALYFATSNPSKLLNAFKKGIDDKSIVTWSYDLDGDFTHTPQQWNKMAWFRPRIVEGKLIFSIIKPVNTKLSSEIYAIFHGRFVEAMLAHCDDLFSECKASSLPAENDQV